MQLVSRRDFGFEDEFEGYVLLKGETPVFQHHLYHDYYSVFWRGSAKLELLHTCLADSVAEICKRVREPFYSLNHGQALFVSGQEITTLPFEIDRDEEDSSRLSVSLGGSQEWLSARQQLAFARFDIESSLSLPIILWGDLDGEADSEVGFSTTAELPVAVLQLLQKTCFLEISDAELEEIRGQVWRHTPQPVH